MLADVAIDPIRARAYVADEANDRVLVLDMMNSSIATSLLVRASPIALAIDPSASLLYVGHAGNRSILVIDLATLTIRRVLDLPFLVFGLVAPTDDSLVATTHDDGWSGQYPYVVNTTDGRVIQRLSDDVGNPVYQDVLPVLSPDRGHLFLVDTLLAPVGILSFTRGTEQTAWSYVGKLPEGSAADVGAYAKDAAVSPDNQYLYLATATTPVLRIATGSLAVVGRIGDSNVSATLAVSFMGETVAISSNSPEISLYTSSGDRLAAVGISGPAKRIRATPDGLWFVVTAGWATQDIEIAPTTAWGAFSPSAYTNDTTPLLSQVVATFAPPSALTFNFTLNRVPLPGATYDPASRELAAEVSTPLLTDVNYGVRVEVSWPGSLAAIDWGFMVHLVPPVLNVIPLPALVTDPVVTVRGNASDAIPLTVSVNGQVVPYWAMGIDGSFTVDVNLTQGNNTIVVVAEDYAGNRATWTWVIAFNPWLDWFSNLDRHFRIPIPYRWEALGSPIKDGVPVDLYMYRSDVQANIIVYSESRRLNGTYDEAQRILREDTDSLTQEAGFRFLSPIRNATIDDHAAATAFVTWQPVNDDPVDQVVTVVVGPEYGMFWAIIGTMYAREHDPRARVINLTAEAFQVLPAGGVSSNGDFPGLQSILITTIIIATTSVHGWPLFKRRRRRQTTDSNADSGRQTYEGGREDAGGQAAGIRLQRDHRS